MPDTRNNSRVFMNTGSHLARAIFTKVGVCWSSSTVLMYYTWHSYYNIWWFCTVKTWSYAMILTSHFLGDFRWSGVIQQSCNATIKVDSLLTLHALQFSDAGPHAHTMCTRLYFESLGTRLGSTDEFRGRSTVSFAYFSGPCPTVGGGRLDIARLSH